MSRIISDCIHKAAVLAAVLAVGCGKVGAVTGPTSPGGAARLSVQVVTNSGQPVTGAAIRLDGVERSETRTDASGRASWQVERGKWYRSVICGGSGPAGVVEGDEVGWLASVPEGTCAR